MTSLIYWLIKLNYLCPTLCHNSRLIKIWVYAPNLYKRNSAHGHRWVLLPQIPCLVWFARLPPYSSKTSRATNWQWMVLTNVSVLNHSKAYDSPSRLLMSKNVYPIWQESLANTNVRHDSPPRVGAIIPTASPSRSAPVWPSVLSIRLSIDPFVPSVCESVRLSVCHKLVFYWKGHLV